MLIGYARVSRLDQNMESQMIALKKYGVDERNIFKEKISALSPYRRELKKALEFLKKGDTFVICKLDRLGRSVNHLIKLVEEFQEKDILFVSITENLNTETATGKLQFHMLAALAEFNRELIRERTLEGLAIARKNGKVLGKQSMLNKIQCEQIEEHLKKGTSKYDIAKILGLKSRSPIYTYLKSKGLM